MPPKHKKVAVRKPIELRKKINQKISLQGGGNDKKKHESDSSSEGSDLE